MTDQRAHQPIPRLLFTFVVVLVCIRLDDAISRNSASTNSSTEDNQETKNDDEEERLVRSFLRWHHIVRVKDLGTVGGEGHGDGFFTTVGSLDTSSSVCLLITKSFCCVYPFLVRLVPKQQLYIHDVRIYWFEVLLW